MEEAGQPIEELFTESKGSKNSPVKMIAIIIGVVIILAAAGFGGYQFLNSQNATVEPTPTPTPTSIPTPTDTPTPTASPSGALKPTAKVTAKVTPTATPTAKITPSAKTTPSASSLDRSKLTIEVLNGSGVTGAAKKLADSLKELGYVISSTGNADADTYEKTVISIKSTKSDYLTQLKKDLSTYTIGSTSATFSGTSDARIIIGKE